MTALIGFHSMIRDLPLLLALLALCALLIWAPLPFGSVTFEARASLQAGCAAALLFALLQRREGGLGMGGRAAAAALILVAAWGLVQALPLPAGVVRALSPRAAELRTAAAALTGARPPARMPLSLAPDLSRRNALWWAAVGAALFAGAAVSRRRWARRALALAMLLAATVEVLYGTHRWTAGESTLWGVTVHGGPGRLRGTFINPDHLALFLELALVTAFAWLWWSLRRARGAETLERRLLLVGPALIVWLGFFASIAFTGSRAGLLGAVLATAAQGAAAALRKRRWGLAPAGLGLAVLGIGTVAAVGLQEGLGRWLSTSPYELTWNSRRTAYAATWELWQRFPWTGTGMASFRDAFPMVQPASIPGGWWHAHNDWLEALATLGLPGALLLLAGLVAAVRRLFQVLGGDNRGEDRAAALAGYGALAAAAVHSALDFGLTIPANALGLAVLVGAAVGAPVTANRDQTPSRRRRRSRRAAAPAALADRDGDAAAREPSAPDAP
jgi:O-antigen ligase